MKAFVRGLAALALAGAALAGNVAAQDQATLDTPREKASYMVGLDVARSLAPAGPDLDVAAFERAVRHAFEGGEPLIAEDKVQPLAEVLMTRIAARDGKPPADGKLPEIDPANRIVVAETLRTRLGELRSDPGLNAWQAWNGGRAAARDALEQAAARGELP